MRSMLFVPGDDRRKLTRAPETGADALILDLEDSVAPGAKQEARSMTAEALAGDAMRGQTRLARINSFASGLAEADIAAIMPASPDGIVLPKCNGPDDLERLSVLLTAHEPATRAGSTRIYAICTETVEGTLMLAATSWAHPRLAALMWGAEDLSADLGAVTNKDEGGRYREPFRLARSLCLMAARRAGVVAVDAVYTDVRDADGLAAETRCALQDGFDAKAAIHPAQIPVIHETMTPDEAELAEARAVLKALEAAGDGVATLDGRMLDAPHRIRALRTLARSE